MESRCVGFKVFHGGALRKMTCVKPFRRLRRSAGLTAAGKSVLLPAGPPAPPPAPRAISETNAMQTEVPTLGGTPVGNDPVALFSSWLEDAVESEPNDPNAVALATVDGDGLPDVRMVLLKGFDARGFVFYTNFESAKGVQALASRKAAMCFHWKSRRRQVRLRGPLEVVSEAEADAYFASRPRGSRIGAWASQQSRPLDSRAALEQKVAELTERYGDAEIPRPPHWSGLRLMPLQIEFWQDGAYRLHDRAVYRRAAPDGAWDVERLYP